MNAWDWANLTQGLLGSALGSVAAALVAVYTVKAGLRVERQNRRVNAVNELRLALDQATSRLIAYYTDATFNADKRDENEDQWKEWSVDEGMELYRTALVRWEPLLGGGLDRRLSRMQSAFTLLHAKGFRHNRKFVAEVVGDAQALLGLLERFEANPTKVERRMKRHDVKKARQQRQGEYIRFHGLY